MGQSDEMRMMHQFWQQGYAHCHAGALGKAAATGKGCGSCGLRCEWNMLCVWGVSRKHLDTMTWSLRDNWLLDFDSGAINIEEIIGDV